MRAYARIGKGRQPINGGCACDQVKKCGVMARQRPNKAQVDSYKMRIAHAFCQPDLEFSNYKAIGARANYAT